MEPRIQYAKTEDGVNIAFSTLGKGVPLVYTTSALFSHLQMEWQLPVLRTWFEQLATRWTLIRFDRRGMGLSEREIGEPSPETFQADLGAVVDALGLKRFALFGNFRSAPNAIAYAARYPERVSHLILFCAFARGADLIRNPQMEAARELVDKDWEVFSETLAHVSVGWSRGDDARRMAELIRESMSPAAYKAMRNASQTVDVADRLPQISASTLVLHRRQLPSLDMRVPRELAISIRDARLVVLEGESFSPNRGDTDAILRAIEEFVGDGQEATAARAAQLPSGTAIILFVDIVSSTALTEELGDQGFRERARKLDELLPPAIGESSGVIVEGKLVGDGVLATFSSARDAIAAAQRCRTVSDEAGLELHLGIHAGDVIREGNNIHGGAVNIASRIADASAPGEILVSDTLRGVARTSADVSFEDRGEHELKGIDEPQRLFAVREQDE